MINEISNIHYLTQQVMKYQSIIHILLQTLNNDVLGFQSLIDPINQCLPRYNSSHSQRNYPLSSSCIHFSFISVADEEKKQQETLFLKIVLLDPETDNNNNNNARYKCSSKRKLIFHLFSSQVYI